MPLNMLVSQLCYETNWVKTCKTVNAVPVPHVDQFTKDKLGEAKLVEETSAGAGAPIVKVTGCPE
jgi:hypothetical protein